MRKITRKIIMVAVMGTLLTLLVAGLAFADVILCDQQNPDTPECFGTPQDDEITGQNDVGDYIYAKAGDDEVTGRDGDDVIYGGDDDDTIDGGEGNDYIVGGEGNNVIGGGLGNDTMLGGNGIDRIVDPGQRDTDRVGSFGGNDVVNVRDDDGRDTVNCGRGRDDTVRADRGDNIAKNCENVKLARR